MKAPGTKTKSRAGFTLIEVVVALGILGFGILAMFSMQTFGIRGNRTANTVTQKVAWGASGLENILLENFDDVVDGSAYPSIKGLDGTKYNVSWNVTPDSPITGMLTLKLDITSVVDNSTTTLTYMRTNEDAL